MISIDRPRGYLRALAGASAVLVLVTACSGSAATAAPTAAAPTAAPPITAAPATAAPATAAPATEAASSSEPSAAAGETYEVTAATVAAGKTLAGENGKTLYIFKKDTTPGKSVCNADCATNWPPFITTAADTLKAGAGVSGTLATIKRDDGTSQVTYNGAPLYYFAGDQKAGDSTGQGIAGIWFIAAP